MIFGEKTLPLHKVNLIKMTRNSFRNAACKAMAACIALSACLPAMAQNPYLPLWEYIPDGEPYVFEDPDKPGHQRVYIYGSHDSRKTEYCGLEQVVWSAPVDNLTDWRYDGIIFRSATNRDGQLLHPDGSGDVLFAPDVTEVVDKEGRKTYYLYPNNQAGGRQGMVAKSARPDGPFEVCNWSRTNPDETEGVLRFDPAVFVDDDGKVYGYWGFETSYAAELDPSTMATVKPGTEIVEYMVPGIRTISISFLRLPPFVRSKTNTYSSTAVSLRMASSGCRRPTILWPTPIATIRSVPIPMAEQSLTDAHVERMRMAM